MRDHAQVTLLPAGRVKGNNPAAMQRMDYPGRRQGVSEGPEARGSDVLTLPAIARHAMMCRLVETK